MKAIDVIERGLGALTEIYGDLDKVEQPGPITRAARDLLTTSIERLGGIGGVNPPISTVPHPRQQVIPSVEPDGNDIPGRVSNMEELLRSHDKEIRGLIQVYTELRQIHKVASRAPSLIDPSDVVDSTAEPIVDPVVTS